jgi:hypothetical protein
VPMRDRPASAPKVYLVRSELDIAVTVLSFSQLVVGTRTKETLVVYGLAWNDPDASTNFATKGRNGE